MATGPVTNQSTESGACMSGFHDLTFDTLIASFEFRFDWHCAQLNFLSEKAPFESKTFTIFLQNFDYEICFVRVL